MTDPEEKQAIEAAAAFCATIPRNINGADFAHILVVIVRYACADDPDHCQIVLDAAKELIAPETPQVLHG